MATIKCSKCGNVYDTDNSFCTNCGQPTSKSQADHAAAEQAARAAQAEQAARAAQAAQAEQAARAAQAAQQTYQHPHQGTAQNNAYQSAQQVPNYAQYRPYAAPVQGKVGGGFGWIVFLRVILWIFFGLIMLSALIAGVEFMSWGDEGVLIGFATILGGALVAFLTVACGMISLNNASNIHKIATNSARILDELQRRK